MPYLKSLIKKPYLIFLLIITVFGIVLRFYKLEEFATFLADQGRDAIIVKRIATFEHFTAIGPPTSIGHIFLGPFYYYFIAPWFWFFNFQPVGLAFGVAFFSTLYILINYFIVEKYINKKTALISSLLISFSATLISFSRFSWNPNVLPLFTLATFYFLIEGFYSKKLFYFILFGSFLSFSIQLHYLSLFLIFPSLIYFLLQFYQNKKNQIKFMIGGLLAVFAFVISSSSLIIFDLKHQFLNWKSFVAFFNNTNQISTNELNNLLVSFNWVNRYILNHSIPYLISNIILVIIICFFVYKLWKSKTKTTPQLAVLLFFVTTILGLSLYPGPKHAHYFGMVFPFYFIIIGIFFSNLSFNKLGLVITLSAVLFYLYFNFLGYFFFWANQQNQIEHARKVSVFLNEQINSQPFNFAVQPDSWQEDAYLYFLELAGKRPANREKQEITQQMFVVCGDPCDLYRTKSWNVTMFGKFKIVNQWSIEGVKIYKLAHQT